MFSQHLRLSAFLLLCACGGAEKNLCVPTDNETVTDQAVVHACLHTTAGPLEQIQAPAGPAMAPELRNLHTSYTLTLQPDSTGTYQGHARFRPRTSGVFAFHLSTPLPVAVFAADGASQCVLQTKQSASLCAGISQSLSFRLQRLQDYDVQFGPGAASSVAVIPEEIWSDDEAR